MTPRSPCLQLRFLAVLATGAAFLFACSAPAPSTKKHKTPIDPGDEFYAADDGSSTDDGLSPTTNPDSGAFSPAGERPAPAPTPSKDGGGPLLDAGHDDGGTAPKVYCEGALKAGDLAVSELLISSRAGANDDGEWVEIRSTRACWLKLNGLSVESPRGTTGVDSVTVSEDFDLAPGGTFIVADSVLPAKNHALPGKVFGWAAMDVLKNDGDTVALKLGAVVIDTVTYPGFSNLVPGRTLAFPSDCPAGVRTDWTRWSLTFDVYTPGFEGTPNATNDDVACY